MAITRISQSSVKEGLEKYNSFYGGLSGAFIGAMESIATITVGSGGASSIEFTSIPGTYQHLQLRVIARSTKAAPEFIDAMEMTINGDNTANYARHGLNGNGTSAVAYGVANANVCMYLSITASMALASTFGVAIVDILDYASTSKNKTVRYFNGRHQNRNDTADMVEIGSGLWRSTNAITSIKFTGYLNSGTFAQHTSVALYGIKAP